MLEHPLAGSTRIELKPCQSNHLEESFSRTVEIPIGLKLQRSPSRLSRPPYDPTLVAGGYALRTEVFGVFLKLGPTSFGGPIAHLGYRRGELVVRRRCIDEASYVDLVAVCQFLRGPTSSQVGFSLSVLRGDGLLGGFAAGELRPCPSDARTDQNEPTFDAGCAQPSSLLRHRA